MSRSATCSEAALQSSTRGRSARLLLVLFSLLALAATGSGRARPFPSTEKALAHAFPGCKIERRTVFLTDEQLALARAGAQLEIESQIVHPYVARCNGEWSGTGYLDRHRVRTEPETLLVALDTKGAVRSIEVLAFREPIDYLPRKLWYRQFEQRSLDRELELGRGIDGVTGATLTARATTNAVRRVLALDRVLREQGLL